MTRRLPLITAVLLALTLSQPFIGCSANSQRDAESFLTGPAPDLIIDGLNLGSEIACLSFKDALDAQKCLAVQRASSSILTEGVKAVRLICDCEVQRRMVLQHPTLVDAGNQ